MAAISEIRIGMGVFSASDDRIGTVYVIDEDRLTLLGDPNSAYADGHYQAALVLIASVHEGRVLLSRDAEAALILEEAYSDEGSARQNVSNDRADSRIPEAGGSGGFDNTAGDGGSTQRRGAGSHSPSNPGAAAVVGIVVLCVVAVAAIPLVLSGRKRTETRPQMAGEAATTRFGMEDGDNTDIPATGGPSSRAS